MISAKIVLDSISPVGIRLTTMELTYPRFIHSELMTHRAFSRNAASSRAIPVKKMIERIREEVALPVRWGLNGKGMQDHGIISEDGAEKAKALWICSAASALTYAEEMLNLREPPHKQIINRLLEPYMHMTTLVTATEWNNFFDLRCHEDADPTFQALADKVRTAYAHGNPLPVDYDDWHAPYIEDRDIDEVMDAVNADREMRVRPSKEKEQVSTMLLLKISAARCSRVSYLNHENKRPALGEDLEQYNRLVAGKLHASPLEHQAKPDRIIVNRTRNTVEWSAPDSHANFVGWIQYRKEHHNENITTHGNILRQMKEEHAAALCESLKSAENVVDLTSKVG